MEEAAALVAECRAQEAADAEKARVARLEKARKMAAAESLNLKVHRFKKPGPHFQRHVKHYLLL